MQNRNKTPEKFNNEKITPNTQRIKTETEKYIKHIFKLTKRHQSFYRILEIITQKTKQEKQHDRIET